MRKRPEWMTVSDLCEELRVTRSTYDRWMRKGSVPPYRRLTSGRVLFDAEDVAEWLDSFLVRP
jgi:excisionase family DNA binding protein